MIQHVDYDSIVKFLSFESSEYFLPETNSFFKVNEKNGYFSNMRGTDVVIPIYDVNGNLIGKFKSSEALYQAMRFPDNEVAQRKIQEQGSPMAAKMVSKPFRKTETRKDWIEGKEIKFDIEANRARNAIMLWALRVKFLRNRYRFGVEYRWIKNDKPIVEISSKDDYWGVKKDKAREDYGSGQNILGKMLTLLNTIFIEHPEMLDSVEVPLPNFLLFGKEIGIQK